MGHAVRCNWQWVGHSLTSSISTFESNLVTLHSSWLQVTAGMWINEEIGNFELFHLKSPLESRHCNDLPVVLPLKPCLTRGYDPRIFKPLHLRQDPVVNPVRALYPLLEENRAVRCEGAERRPYQWGSWPVTQCWGDPTGLFSPVAEHWWCSFGK